MHLRFTPYQVTKAGPKLQVFKSIVVGLMLWCPVAAHAQEFSDILEAEQAGDYSDAIDMLSLHRSRNGPFGNENAAVIAHL